MTEARRIKNALERVRLLTIPEMATALDAEPRAHGFYAWWLINLDACRKLLRRLTHLSRWVSSTSASDRAGLPR